MRIDVPDRLISQLSDAELRKCREIGTELAAKAAAQHTGAVEEAHSIIRTVFDELQGEIEAESLNRWCVTAQNFEVKQDKWGTLVALTEMNGEHALGHHWEIIVETELVVEEAPRSVTCVYRTTGKMAHAGMNEMGVPDATLVDIIAPREIGEMVS
jgi:hypothetical protein